MGEAITTAAMAVTTRTGMYGLIDVMATIVLSQSYAAFEQTGMMVKARKLSISHRIYP